MPPSAEPVYFVQISDSHIGPTRDFTRHGYRSWPAAHEVVTRLNRLPQPPDVIFHTGDVVTDPDPEAYALARDTFARLEAPLYFVVGNHDRAADIRRHLPLGPHEPLSDNPDLLTYAVEIKGYRFLVVDARAPDHLDPHGQLGEEQLAIVRNEAAATGPPLVVLIHFPIWPLNAPWFDQNMLVLNGRELHEALLPARGRLRGVFHGHIHMACQTVRDGILYSAAPSTFANFAAWPQDTEPRFVDDPPGFCFVHLLPDQTIIHHHTIDRPGSLS